MQIDVIVDEKRAAITLRLRARRCRPKLCQDYPEAKLEVLYLLKGGRRALVRAEAFVRCRTGHSAVPSPRERPRRPAPALNRRSLWPPLITDAVLAVTVVS